jgi:TRAP-type mannitol/chloroaromatic compound transport system substrate-binding protein
MDVDCIPRGFHFRQLLEKSLRLDGAEWSAPEDHFRLGLHKAAKHCYYPGFYSPFRLALPMFNIDRWNAMDAAARGLIEEACRAQIDALLKTNDDRVERGLIRLRGAGVTVHAFTPAILNAVGSAMREVVDETSASDLQFKQMWSSYTFRR